MKQRQDESYDKDADIIPYIHLIPSWDVQEADVGRTTGPEFGIHWANHLADPDETSGVKSSDLLLGGLKWREYWLFFPQILLIFTKLQFQFKLFEIQEKLFKLLLWKLALSVSTLGTRKDRTRSSWSDCAAHSIGVPGKWTQKDEWSAKLLVECL